MKNLTVKEPKESAATRMQLLKLAVKTMPKCACNWEVLLRAQSFVEWARTGKMPIIPQEPKG
jgi:hypothetical protein